MPRWREEDRRALQDVARAAREVAARPGLSAITSRDLEAIADALTSVRSRRARGRRARPTAPP